MSAAFDPYYKWLGIPSAEQPANHYRLLGVTLFESDQEVIESAAEQRMSYLRTLRSGVLGSVAQSLLNEIGEAKICLLKPERKANYDGALRAKLAMQSSAPPIAKSHPGFFERAPVDYRLFLPCCPIQPPIGLNCLQRSPCAGINRPGGRPEATELVGGSDAVELDTLGITQAPRSQFHRQSRLPSINWALGPISLGVFVLGVALVIEARKEVHDWGDDSRPPAVTDRLTPGDTALGDTSPANSSADARIRSRSGGSAHSWKP
jgi:hypothetical protein